MSLADAPIADGRATQRGAPALFLLLITVSGLAALIYQVAWTRRLSLLLGVSTYAVATVLAAFLGGLALGAWLLGGPIDRARRPLRIYAALEAGTGLLALLFPFLLEGVHRLTSGRQDGASIIIATPFERDPELAKATLEQFTGAMLEDIEVSLDDGLVD